MKIIFISNAYQLTKNILDKIEIDDDDLIVLFKQMNTLEYFKNRKDQIINCTRCNQKEIKEVDKIIQSNIKETIIFGIPKRFERNPSLILKNKNSKLNDIINSKIKFKLFPNINKEMKDLMNINFNLTTGFLALLYFDYLYPNEKKLLVGFSTSSSRKNIKHFPCHNFEEERNLLLGYCKSKEKLINFHYCCINEEDKLVNVYPKLPKQKLKINILKFKDFLLKT